MLDYLSVMHPQSFHGYIIQTCRQYVSNSHVGFSTPQFSSVTSYVLNLCDTQSTVRAGDHAPISPSETGTRELFSCVYYLVYYSGGVRDLFS